MNIISIDKTNLIPKIKDENWHCQTITDELMKEYGIPLVERDNFNRCLKSIKKAFDQRYKRANRWINKMDPEWLRSPIIFE